MFWWISYHYCSNGHRKKNRKFYNWKCFWCGNVVLFSNTDSHVNFCIYLISWIRYAMPSTENSRKKSCNENAVFFFKPDFFFCQYLTVWTKVQEINVCGTRYSLSKVSAYNMWYMWHSACAHTHFAHQFFFVHCILLYYQWIFFYTFFTIYIYFS